MKWEENCFLYGASSLYWNWSWEEILQKGREVDSFHEVPLSFLFLSKSETKLKLLVFKKIFFQKLFEYYAEADSQLD